MRHTYVWIQYKRLEIILITILSIDDHCAKMSNFPFFFFFFAGRTSVPAALCTLSLFACPPPAGVSGLPAAAGLRVAAVASVPSGAGFL